MTELLGHLSPPTHAAVTAFATRAKRNVIVHAGERRAGGFPPGLLVRSCNRARSTRQTLPVVRDLKANLVSPQRWNRYSYVSNNPISKIDPTGRYEEDVHYQLTYALSRAAGFSTGQAGAIAGGDQGVDDNPETSPFKSTEVRAAYHFTTPARRGQMWSAFEKSGSLTALGQFFHAQQDSYSHAGYGPKVGHAAAGHGPDKTFNDPAKALTMAHDTYTRLNQAADKLGIPRADRVA